MTDVSEQSVADVLNRAADLLEKPGAWTQGVFARDRDGHVTLAGSPKAVCYCGAGAIYAQNVGSHMADRCIDIMSSHVGVSRFAKWNDTPKWKQAEVVAAFRNRAALLAAPRAGEV